METQSENGKIGVRSARDRRLVALGAGGAEVTG
jgi:hypothetical protein